MRASRLSPLNLSLYCMAKGYLNPIKMQITRMNQNRERGVQANFTAAANKSCGCRSECRHEKWVEMSATDKFLENMTFSACDSNRTLRPPSTLRPPPLRHYPHSTEIVRNVARQKRQAALRGKKYQFCERLGRDEK